MSHTKIAEQATCSYKNGRREQMDFRYFKNQTKNSNLLQLCLVTWEWCARGKIHLTLYPHFKLSGSN